jgi:hypothetical protein
MGDPNADPTPEQLAEWWTTDLASALKWAEGRLARAKQLGDVEIRQHLGNLVKAARTLSTARAEVAALTAEVGHLEAEISHLEADNVRLHEAYMSLAHVSQRIAARKDPDR